MAGIAEGAADTNYCQWREETRSSKEDEKEEGLIISHLFL